MPSKLGLGAFCKRHHHCGCQAAPCCFECSLPDCTINTLRKPETVLQDQKAKELRAKGMTADEIALELGVSTRSVWRGLRAS